MSGWSWTGTGPTSAPGRGGAPRLAAALVGALLLTAVTALVGALLLTAVTVGAAVVARSPWEG